MPLIVYHKNMSYLIAWLGMREVGALEPKPGLPPTASHLSELLAQLQRDPAKAIVLAAYNDPRGGDWLSEHAKIPRADAAVHGRRQRQGERPVRPVRRQHRATAGGQMNIADLDLTILLPAFVAGLLVTATHVPLGIQVLNARHRVHRSCDRADRGLRRDPRQFARRGHRRACWCRLSALSAALGGALLLTWTEKHWPEVQEAIIGTVFVLAASGAILLLSAEGGHHGHRSSEHLKDLLVGQILWVNWHTVALVALLYAVLLAVWFGVGQARLKRAGFYVVFACAVTASVQLVGLYLVFATLIVPALATRRMVRGRLAVELCTRRGGLRGGTHRIGIDRLAVGTRDRVGDDGARRACIRLRAASKNPRAQITELMFSMLVPVMDVRQMGMGV